MQTRRITERAQAAVELAICLPLLLLLLGGIYVFGQAFVEVQQLSGAASEGARTAAYNSREADRVALVESAVTNAAQLGSGGRLRPSQITVATSGSWTPGNSVTVSATYPVRLDFAFISIDRTVTRRRTMRVIQ